jgi:hypothetical protein
LCRSPLLISYYCECELWCFGLFWAMVLHCFPGCSCAGAVQRLCHLEFLHLRFCPLSNAFMRPSFSFPSRNFDLSSSAASVCRPRIIWARRQGVRAKVSVRSCRGSVRSSLGSIRSLSDRAEALSDRHLAQPGLCPIVSGLCPIVTWLSQTSIRSCWVSVRSSLVSARPLSDRVGSLSDRHLAQPGLCPIVPGLYPIVILLCLFIRVVSLARFIL